VLAAADVVFYDSLAESSLLDLAPARATRVFVGKRPGAPMNQEEINELLVRHGREGRRVVRLKGGDPFVFGRGGEEAEALLAAGVPFEVVPGITSAVAVPAYAGVPVTHRGLSTSFTVVTGHSRHAVDRDTDWEALAVAGGTIVVLMGVAHRAEIARRLMAAGLAADTPVVAVRWGTRPDQLTIRTTLASLGGIELDPPVTIVIGRVAGLNLAWFESRPLFGRRVVVTRARHQVSGLVERLRALGAGIIEIPTIEIVDAADGGERLRQAVAQLASYDWVVFTSANAVERVLAEVPDARRFGGARIAAVGRATAAALGRARLVADLVPERFVAEGLLDVFPSGPGRVLLPRAAEARDVLPEGLVARGFVVEVVDAYRTVAANPDPALLDAAAEADAITFTSSSTVTNFLAVAGRQRVPAVVACIGPITARTAEEAGLGVDVIAEESSVDALADGLARRIGR